MKTIPRILNGLLALTVAGTVCAAPAGAAEFFTYFGTYSRDGSQGIYVSRFDTTSGKLSPPELAAQTPNPSFLAIHPNQKYLYSASEISQFEGQKSGAVSAFAIDPATGKLKLINSVASAGTGPCHLVVSDNGKTLLVANYGSGSVASLPVNADGSLGEAVSKIQHEGSSANPQRQRGPHAHSVNLTPDNKFAIVADLGIDKLMVYRLDAEKSVLSPASPPFHAMQPGAGPRHFAFHPNGRFGYVINELQSTVTALRWNGKSFQEIATVSTLPPDFTGNNTTAEVLVHPNGKFLYGSNRGHNSIAVFAIDPRKGTLKAVQQESSRGEIPRNFRIDPTGSFLLAANQNSANVVVFRIDAATGKLTPTGNEVKVVLPVCIKFVPVR